jgi:hypothetical protein
MWIWLRGDRAGYDQILGELPSCGVAVSDAGAISMPARRPRFHADQEGLKMEIKWAGAVFWAHCTKFEQTGDVNRMID